MVYIQRLILKACLSILLQKHLKVEGDPSSYLCKKKSLGVQRRVRAKSLPADRAMSLQTSMVLLRVGLWVITR